ncbi:hypothetical protein ONZ45_g5151 [Pleurotus djamor]|nr:hypothetical protein ONZ45_g5151 [Pleurotus djamor]
MEDTSYREHAILTTDFAFMESRPGTPLGRCEPTVQRFTIYDAPNLELSTPPPSSPVFLRFPTGDPVAVPSTPTAASQLSSFRPPLPGDSPESYDATSPVGTKRVRSTQDIVTPQKRANSKSSLGAAAKYRVSDASQKATLKQDGDGHLYCVATGMRHGRLPLEFSHVLPLGTSPDVLTKLEWAWDMGYGHLNLNSRYNIQILTEALHTLFDHRASYWFWLPLDTNVVTSLHSCYVGEKKAINGRFDPTQLFTIEPKHCFHYALVVPENLRKESFAFFRFQGDSPETPTEKANSITYEPISPVDLHLSPHYVIFDLGRKLERYKDSEATDWEGIQARLQEEFEFTEDAYWLNLKFCYEIYRAWMETTPSAEFTQTEMPATNFVHFTEANFLHSSRRYLDSKIIMSKRLHKSFTICDAVEYHEPQDIIRTKPSEDSPLQVPLYPKLHIPSHILVYDVGRKLTTRYSSSNWDDVYPRALKDYVLTGPFDEHFLKSCFKIYLVWMKAEPSEEWLSIPIPPHPGGSFGLAETVDHFEDLVALDPLDSSSNYKPPSGCSSFVSSDDEEVVVTDQWYASKTSVEQWIQTLEPLDSENTPPASPGGSDVSSDIFVGSDNDGTLTASTTPERSFADVKNIDAPTNQQDLYMVTVMHMFFVRVPSVSTLLLPVTYLQFEVRLHPPSLNPPLDIEIDVDSEVFVGAPSRADAVKDPSSFQWQNVYSTSASGSAPNASILHPFPPATLEAASRRISEFYRNIIFDDADEGDDEPPQDDNTTMITWDDSFTSEAGQPSATIEHTKLGLSIISRENSSIQVTQEETQDTSAFYSDTSSIGRFPTFTFNLHTLSPLSNLPKFNNYAKVNVLAAVLELDGPDVIHVKKGPDAGKEVSILKLVLGDEGNVCKLTVWREVAEDWAPLLKRGDIVYFESLGVTKDTTVAPAAPSTNLTASPNNKSRLQVCFRSMPATNDDLRLRPDLRLGYSDPAVRKVAEVTTWFEGMAGLRT